MMQCYHETEGGKYQECEMQDGFQTCFTKYDQSKFHILKLLFVLWYVSFKIKQQMKNIVITLQWNIINDVP